MISLRHYQRVISNSAKKYYYTRSTVAYCSLVVLHQSRPCVSRSDDVCREAAHRRGRREPTTRAKYRGGDGFDEEEILGDQRGGLPRPDEAISDEKYHRLLGISSDEKAPNEEPSWSRGR
jgi:hypothetical protein